MIHSGDIGTFFNWMDPKDIPAELRFLNALYRMCLEIGKIKVFYDVLKCDVKDKYKRKKNNLTRDVFDKKSDRFRLP